MYDVYVGACVYHGTHVEVSGQFCKADSFLLPLWGLQGLNSGHQACMHKPLSLLSHLTNPHQRILKTKRNFLVQRWVTSQVQKDHTPWLIVLTRYKNHSQSKAHCPHCTPMLVTAPLLLVKCNRMDISTLKVNLSAGYPHRKMPVSSWPLNSHVKLARFDTLVKFSISMFPSK